MIYFVYEKSNLEEVSKPSKARMFVTPELEKQVRAKYIDWEHLTVYRNESRPDMHVLPDHTELIPEQTITVTLWPNDVKTTIHLIGTENDMRELAKAMLKVLDNSETYKTVHDKVEVQSSLVN
jgi:hypothetical protein